MDRSSPDASGSHSIFTFLSSASSEFQMSSDSACTGRVVASLSRKSSCTLEFDRLWHVDDSPNLQQFHRSLYPTPNQGGWFAVISIGPPPPRPRKRAFWFRQEFGWPRPRLDAVPARSGIIRSNRVHSGPSSLKVQNKVQTGNGRQAARRPFPFKYFRIYGAERGT